MNQDNISLSEEGGKDLTSATTFSENIEEELDLKMAKSTSVSAVRVGVDSETTPKIVTEEHNCDQEQTCDLLTGAEERKELEKEMETGVVDEARTDLEMSMSVDVSHDKTNVIREPISHQLERDAVATADDAVKVLSSELFIIDKDAVGEAREEEEVQYIDEEAVEEHQLLDINSDSETISQNESTKGKMVLVKSGDIDVRASSEPLKSCQQHEGIDDSKFEEISEGSIGQVEQEEVLKESLSDVKKVAVPVRYQSSVEAQHKTKTRLPYKEAESLEEVFFATENDDIKITAEDKDNDDISDASLSDHADDNLSLEEISDEDLEPSKRKRRSSGLMIEKIMTGEKKDGVKISAIQNVNMSRSDEKLEAHKSTSQGIYVNKRSASEDFISAEGSFKKRLKLSNDKMNTSKPSSRTDEPAFTTGISTESQKLEKHSQTADAMQNRNNLLQTRNPTQVPRHERNLSKERSQSGRDYLEQRRKHNLVNSSCQTERRLLKGKIVQCNINPIKLTLEADKQDNTFSSSKLLSKFKHQLPSSIPELTFASITSLQPPETENCYSFGMGPVTLSDMDSLEFRNAALRSVEKFHLVFNHHCQGATVSRHEDMVSLIRQLKRLELGNRYMLMSVLYRTNEGELETVWKATIMFIVYKQNIQVGCHVQVNDGKVHAKLSLYNVPHGVSKDFIQLLFPEALSVSIAPGPSEDRVVTLGFSSPKLVEQILSCYDLLIINGSQVSILQTDVVEEQHFTQVIVDESGTIEDTIDIKARSEMTNGREVAECVTAAAQETSISAVSSESSSQGVVVKSDKVCGTVEEEFVGESQANNKQILKKAEEMMTVSHKITPETAETTDLLSVHASRMQAQETDKETVSTIAHDILASILDLVCAKSQENVRNQDICKDDDDDDDVVILDIREEKVEVPSQTTGNEQESILEVMSEGSSKTKRTDRPVSNSDELRHENVIASVGNVVLVENDNLVKNENLEDVSDDEMISQMKGDDLDDVISVRETSPERVVTNTGTTQERPSTWDVKVSSQIEQKSKNDVNGGTEQALEPKLLMTDGNLEVSLEVIDVQEDDEESEKVISSRRWSPSWKSSREKISVEKDSLSPVHYATSWSEDQMAKSAQCIKSKGYNNSREAYTRRYTRDDMSRISSKHHCPSSSREDGSRCTVPSREETSYRRDSYRHEHRSPSPPRKDASWYRDTETYKHSRSPYSSEYYENCDRKYNSNVQWNKNNDSWQSSYHRDSARAGHFTQHSKWQTGSSTYQSPTWHGEIHSSVKSKDNRGTYSQHKYSPRRSRSRSESLSDLSFSSTSRSPVRYKLNNRRKNPPGPTVQTSHSPISVSSQSHSLSPVSKSSSRAHSPAAKKELVETVKQFLHLAKGLQQHNQRRRYSHSNSPRNCSSQRSKSPHNVRPCSPLQSPGQHERYVFHHSRHSRSPHHVLQSRNSKSPINSRSHKERHNRSPSPVSSNDSRSRHSKMGSYSDKNRGAREADNATYYDSKKSKKSLDHSSSHVDQSDRPVSEQWSSQRSTEQYKQSTDLAWYEQKQSSQTMLDFNPAYPPPFTYPAGNPYPASTMPAYPYGNPPHYNCCPTSSGTNDSYVQSLPPSQLAQAYQQAFSLLHSAMSNPAPTHGYSPPPTPVLSSVQANTAAAASNSDKKGVAPQRKKLWTLGGNAMVFQRILGKEGGKPNISGGIEKVEDRERLERPKIAKERILTKVPVQKK